MEKLISHCDMELVKMAMLRHEETFRHQVHELHRLYRVQKQLMGILSWPSSSELGCRRRIRRRRQPRHALNLHRRLPADECVVVTPPSAEDGLELTLAIRSGGQYLTRTANPLGSEPDISGGDPTTASSTETGGSPPYQRTMSAFRLQEAATVAKQPPRSPWCLVECVGIEMAA